MPRGSNKPVRIFSNRAAAVTSRLQFPCSTAVRCRKAESFMKTLKQEEINGSSYRNLRQARNAVGAFIENVYNRQGSIRLWPIARLTSTKQH